MFRISFGSNNGNGNDRTVNRNATLTAPTILAVNAPPGYYTVTMTRVDTPYLQWIKVNMPSTVKTGADIVPYEPPLTDPQLPPPGPMQFIVTIWRQTSGRLSPTPRAPSNRLRFNLDQFARKNRLVDVHHTRFFVK